VKLYFDTRGLVWMAKYPQAGSSTGWSDFTVIDRVQAMYYIERQFEITYI